MPSNQPIIQLRNVTKSYDMGETQVHALRGVDFTVKPGEFISIIGPSGSGKSTLMHMSSLLDNPTSGEVIFDSTDTTTFSEAELARIRNNNIGFVFQQFNLLSRTSACDNVSLPLVYSNINQSQRTQIAQQMLVKVGLSNRIQNTPAQLSGGQQQRVAIARALVNQPKVIFADEPTGNLDTNSGKEIIDIFSKLNQEGKTIIMVTHELSIAQIAKRIITIKDGLIIKDVKS